MDNYGNFGNFKRQVSLPSKVGGEIKYIYKISPVMEERGHHRNLCLAKWTIDSEVVQYTYLLDFTGFVDLAEISAYPR